MTTTYLLGPERDEPKWDKGKAFAAGYDSFVS